MKRPQIISLIKEVKRTAPDVKIILCGSEARGGAHPDSDIDLLLLLDKDIITLNRIYYACFYARCSVNSSSKRGCYPFREAFNNYILYCHWLYIACVLYLYALRIESICPARRAYRSDKPQIHSLFRMHKTSLCNV